MPFLSSNIPYNIFDNTILSEVLRIAQFSLLYSDFLNKARELCSRMKVQGAEIVFSKTSLLRFMNKHPLIFNKYNVPLRFMNKHPLVFNKYNVPFHSIVDSCYE